VNLAGRVPDPTLFSNGPGGGSFPLAISNVTGSVSFDGSGTLVTSLVTTFQVDSGTPAGSSP